MDRRRPLAVWEHKAQASAQGRSSGCPHEKAGGAPGVHSGEADGPGAGCQPASTGRSFTGQRVHLGGQPLHSQPLCDGASAIWRPQAITGHSGAPLQGKEAGAFVPSPSPPLCPPLPITRPPPPHLQPRGSPPAATCHCTGHAFEKSLSRQAGRRRACFNTDVSLWVIYLFIYLAGDGGGAFIKVIRSTFCQVLRLSVPRKGRNTSVGWAQNCSEKTRQAACCCSTINFFIIIIQKHLIACDLQVGERIGWGMVGLEGRSPEGRGPGFQSLFWLCASEHGLC